MRLRGADRGRRLRGDERVPVDLPVRVREGDTDLHAAVLEAEDLLDTGLRGQRGGAVGPGLDHGPHPGGRQRRQDGVVVGGEAHHLAAPVARSGVEQPTTGCCVTDAGEGREPVLEDHHIVVRGGDLALVARRGRAQRAGVRRRVVGAGLPVAGDAHPFPEQRVVPDLRPGDHRWQGPADRGEPLRRQGFRRSR